MTANNETSVVCPACDGDGWGIETDGLVTVMTEHGCRACTGSGRVSGDPQPEPPDDHPTLFD
jgi:hypothetical protein